MIAQPLDRLRKSTLRGAFSSFGALAFSQLIHAKTLDYGVAVGVKSERVVEYSATGSRLVQEFGSAPQLVLSAAVSDEAYRFDATLRLDRYDIQYHGQTQGGRPLDTTTDYATSLASFNSSLPIYKRTFVGLGVAFERRERHIRAVRLVRSLDEAYETTWGCVGAAYRGAQWMIALVWQRPLRYRETVSSPGLIDPATIEAIEGRAVRTEVAFTADNSRGLTVGMFTEYVSTERSENVVWRRDGARQGILAQPEMTRKAIGIEVGYRW